MYISGVSVTNISNDLGISITTVYLWLRNQDKIKSKLILTNEVVDVNYFKKEISKFEKEKNVLIATIKIVAIN